MEKEILEKIVSESDTIHSVLVKMGKNTSAASYKLFHRKVKKYSIDISHFLTRAEYTAKQFKEGNLKKIPTNEMFTENSTISRHIVKNRVISENILKYECSMCGNDGNWNGSKISLILDHINGVNNDNRLDNLRFVCPNCNATLDTHCKGSKGLISKIPKVKKLIRADRPSLRKVERPDMNTLLNEVEQMGYSATGKKYGVSDNAIRKWINRYKKIDL
jgi:predicted RNA-binding Zn-ribbon protein involved in translation (DUF1610 family)